MDDDVNDDVSDDTDDEDGEMVLDDSPEGASKTTLRATKRRRRRRRGDKLPQPVIEVLITTPNDLQDDVSTTLM